MIKRFLSDKFLLQNKMAERLYHEYAADQPIIDYHNHLPPDQIALNANFTNLTEVWLQGDHYKWRAMRANDVAEKYITGSAPSREKFMQWAATVPYTMRNPLYHWTHLELQRYFGIKELLTPDTAESIYERANEMLATNEFTPRGLLQKMKVEVVCTTDHPTDSLAHHQAYRAEEQEMKMLPTFRPDKFLIPDAPDFVEFLEKLEKITDRNIGSFSDLLDALKERIEFFASLGCQLADHGLSRLYPLEASERELDEILEKARTHSVEITPEESATFQMSLLYELARRYHARKWTMQLHLGPLRNNNTRMLREIGADVGCDSIGDEPQARGLSYFLNRLDAVESLPKTILYNLNPRDNEVFATMAGNFSGGAQAGTIQWGSAWWFLDQKDGMEKQLNTLSNMGLLSRFIGMLTDSRSFLSFPRHEYFRRLLCNLIGEDVHQGNLPDDLPWLGSLVEGICYKNARDYFNF